MANVTYGHFVYGLRDLKVKEAGGSTWGDLDAAQQLEFTPRVRGATLEGDDVEKVTFSNIIGGEGRISAGSLSTEALAKMIGNALTTSGSTPNEITTLSLAAGDTLPYFEIMGQSLDEGDGDLHIKIYKAKLNSGFSIRANGNNWLVPDLSFTAVGDAANSDKVVDLIQHETATAIS